MLARRNAGGRRTVPAVPAVAPCLLPLSRCATLAERALLPQAHPANECQPCYLSAFLCPLQYVALAKAQGLSEEALVRASEVRAALVF